MHIVINPEKFKSLSSGLQKYIDENQTGGISCLVYHKDKVVFKNNFGWKDKLNEELMDFNTIFRIYSMTKPIVCLTALTLYEEGKFDLDDPISRYLPEFSNLTVMKSYDKVTGEAKIANTDKQITIRQLFTHTSGLSYGLFPMISIDKVYAKEFKYDITNPIALLMSGRRMYLEEFSKQISNLPLAFEPGSHWWYAFGHDILGYLIQKLTGKTLDEVLKERIFDKLGMDDTGFYVPEDKWHRLSKAYTHDEAGKLVEINGIFNQTFKRKPRFLSGGGGLVSTLNDYLKFTLMMLNGGEFNGVKIVSKDIIELMIRNHLPNNKSRLEMGHIKIEDPEQIRLAEGYGFGLGVEVKIEENITKCSIGTHSWGGAMNTMYWIDPKNQLITILMTQLAPTDFRWIFPIDGIHVRKLVYDAIM
ncbi:MAG: serine hydrolase domain-containing protein [Candidatus Kariarchaeaceae archaeon]|jgi:CubicO group peptidase (beta-lactamase class C family)